MDELEALKERLNNETEFISNMADYICDCIDTSSARVISAAEKLVLEHNERIVKEKRGELAKLEKILMLKEEPSKENFKKEEKKTEVPSQKERKEYADFIIKMLQDEKTISIILKTFSAQEMKECKLAIFEKILKLEEEIKESIIEDASRSITPLQEKRTILKNLLKRITEETKEKEEKNIFKEITTQSETKVFFLPNGKGSTYFADDIKYHLEKREEIRNALTKIESGYFLETKKDTKKLQDMKENLCEYKGLNGIRILYIVMGEKMYAICGLFYKDKQKSTKIAEYFAEAIRRFNMQKKYLEENIGNPNLYIEQAELIGELYALLEPKTPVLKEVL